MSIYEFEKMDQIPTPALIYYKDLILDNTKRLIVSAGSADRLWPHVKSHKMSKLVEMQIGLGISKFKCATLSEADMVARLNPKAILVAYPLIGIAADIFANLIQCYPQIEFYTIVDSLCCAENLAKQAKIRNILINILIDINTGLDRTGVKIGDATEFARSISDIKGLRIRGLHIYDGNFHFSSLDKRMENVRVLDADIYSLISRLKENRIILDTVVIGGSGTMPCHELLSDFYLSPGTLFINDYGYSNLYKDLDYIPAGLVLGRVISHPKHNYFTVDVGYKAIGAEMDGPAGKILDVDAHSVFQNEEHWVFEMDEGKELSIPSIGSTLLIIPTHICSTTNLYTKAIVISDSKIVDQWETEAHKRSVDLVIS